MKKQLFLLFVFAMMLAALKPVPHSGSVKDTLNDYYKKESYAKKRN